MRRFIALVAIVSGLVGCNAASSDNPVASAAANGVNITGRIDMGGAGNMSASRITISCAGLSAHPDAQGNYVIQGAIPAGRVAARAAGALDTAYIIVGSDTLREVPVTSWSQVLPTNYVVQRNVSVTSLTWTATQAVQAVYWANDSIAHVVDLAPGTSAIHYSGYIYSVYNDSQYAANAQLYTLVTRARDSGKVLWCSSPTAVTAKVGDLAYTSSQLVDLSQPNSSTYRYMHVADDSSLNIYRDTIRYMRQSLPVVGSRDLSGTGTWLDNRTMLAVPVSSSGISLTAGRMVVYMDTAHDSSLRTLPTIIYGPTVDTSVVVRLDSLRIKFKGKAGQTAKISFFGLTGPYTFTDTLTIVCTGETQESVVVRKATWFFAKLQSTVSLTDVSVTVYYNWYKRFAAFYTR